MFKKVLFVMLFSMSAAFSYSFTCLPPMTVEKSVAINPVFFADDNNSGGAETFFYYGITPKFDISSSILTVAGTSNFSTMVRYSLQSYVLGIRANASWAVPQVSYCWEDDRFIFQACVASQFTYDYSDKPAIFGVVCPGYKFSDGVNFCLDLNPGYYMQDGDFANSAVRTEGFGLDVAPSLGIQVGDCVFSIAVPIFNVTQKDPVTTFGAWVYYSIKSK